MTHARTTIRNWVATALDGLATTADRVHTSRVHRYAVHQLPALNVLTGREEVTEDSTRDSDFRQLEVEVEARAKAVEDLDDTIDQIAKEVEHALHAATRPSNVIHVAYENTEIEFDEKSDQPTALMRLTYSVLYRVTPGNPVL